MNMEINGVLRITLDKLAKNFQLKAQRLVDKK